MDYFEFYGIPADFQLNLKGLKLTYLQNSKKYHPDFHTDKTEEEQARFLELSTLNNEAYKVLSDLDKRMKYILDQKGLLQEGKDKLPQDFLMEMMDINEAIMELEFEPDEDKLKQLHEDVSELIRSLNGEMESTLLNYNPNNPDEGELSRIKNYYLKRRYIWRIRENLTKFASASK